MQSCSESVVVFFKQDCAKAGRGVKKGRKREGGKEGEGEREKRPMRREGEEERGEEPGGKWERGGNLVECTWYSIMVAHCCSCIMGNVYESL